MTRTSRTASTLALTLLLLSLLFVAVTGAAQQARWHRYSQSVLDPLTTIDTVKDVFSGQCYAVYVHTPSPGAVTSGAGPTAIAVQTITVVAATTTLGPVPCEPVVGR